MTQSRRAFCAGLTALPLLRGQQPPSDSDPVITLDVTRVNLLFTVSDRRGRFVNNLTADDFQVVEHKRPQKILEFASESDLPLRIGILVDTSNSIRDRFKFELETASHFLETVIRKGRDKALIYSFDNQAELVQDLTDDVNLLGKKLRSLRAGGGTAMYEAMYLASRDHLMQDQPRHKYRRAIILIGDGDDNASRFSRDQALEMVHKADGVIYCISTNQTGMNNIGDKTLKYFAEETGGQAFFPFKAQDLAQDFENIANELRSQYSILYRPEPLITDGKYHPILVRVRNQRGLVVRSRKGYYAPLSM
ncbi:MAG: VWA domain-containing protein [Bryobacteraceae bacterium]|nr:VWA domain-containing protein [Solibacteraceae bacterium]MCL4840613.1 VWA domain-containing protein [Bryobacteraceae bacterium]MCO5350567.1 VWA domain-containing protein [Bryobacteraceae bacterium]